MQARGWEASWSQKASAACRYFLARFSGYPTLVNLEVTRRCNARCDFCRYWSSPSEEPLRDYLPALRRLRPSAVMITGGEPLLRRDLAGLIRAIRSAYPAIFLGLVTNGARLTLERGVELWNAGLTQLTVSLDFPDARHDAARGIPGLADRIRTVVPRLAASGVDNIVVQTVIKSDNLDCVAELVDWARKSSVKISLSAYTVAKNGNDAHMVREPETQRVGHLVTKLLEAKLAGAPIASSSYYLGRIPEFFAAGAIQGCTSGRTFLTVSPSGMVYRCSESEEGCHYTEWRPRRFAPTECGRCWVPCRGESQAPINWERIRQVAALYRPHRRPVTDSGSHDYRPPAQAA